MKRKNYGAVQPSQKLKFVSSNKISGFVLLRAEAVDRLMLGFRRRQQYHIDEKLARLDQMEHCSQDIKEAVGVMSKKGVF